MSTKSTSKVYFAVSMSLDGYIAPDGMDLEHGHDPDYKDWARKWFALQDWLVTQQFFRQNLKMGEDGETGPDNDRARQLFERTGATVLGKRMFDGDVALARFSLVDTVVSPSGVAIHSFVRDSAV